MEISGQVLERRLTSSLTRERHHSTGVRAGG